MLKTILLVVVLAALLFGAMLAFYWKTMLPASQKLRYGRVFEAVEDYGAAARAHPEDAAALSDYAEALAQKGNFGRARYLVELYGAQSATLSELLPEFEEAQQAAAEDDGGGDGDGAAGKGRPGHEFLRRAGSCPRRTAPAASSHT